MFVRNVLKIQKRFITIKSSRRSIYLKALNQKQIDSNGVQFNKNNRGKLMRLSTHETILNDLENTNTNIWSLDLPCDDPLFRIIKTSYLYQPYQTNILNLNKSYDLKSKATFDFLDRIYCKKDFLQDSKSREKLIKLFIFNKNTEGLLWIYNNLLSYDKEQYEILSKNGTTRFDFGYFGSVPDFFSILRSSLESLKETDIADAAYLSEILHLLEINDNDKWWE
jgi:hypothetical protein